jgi:hypothetical protein
MWVHVAERADFADSIHGYTGLVNTGFVSETSTMGVVSSRSIPSLFGCVVGFGTPASSPSLTPVPIMVRFGSIVFLVLWF